MIYIGYDSDAEYARAQQLATQFNFVIDQIALPRLQVSKNFLSLIDNQISPVWVDLNSQTWQHRRNAGKQQGLIRAIKPKPGMHIIDATAGWGRDGAIMASFGADVTMLERQSFMAALLMDGLDRAKIESRQKLNLNLIYTDAHTYLQALQPDDYPDVIYIDPMHPTRQKSSLVKKDLQLLQKLIGPDEDVVGFIELAKSRTRGRVVVKWPQHQTALLTARASVPGKTIRFDIY